MLVYGFWPFSADPPLHESWYYHFSKQFWRGELYPRWLTGMNEGLGSPVFFYYAPLPFWITSLLHPFVQNDPAGWRQLGDSVFLSLALSGIGCFLWLRRLTNKRAAFITAILFMLMPYHLAMDLYNRGAFTEFWAFTWIPFVFLFVDRIFHGNRVAVLGLAFSYAALVMTHLPTTLIFSPVVLCYVILNWRLSKNGKLTLSAVLGIVLGIGLAAIYLVPAMTMQRHAAMDALYQFHYDKSFFFGRSFLFGDGFKATLLACALTTMATASCCGFIAKRSASSAVRSQMYFWGAVLTFTFFMMLPLSNFLWRLFPILQIIQFPWRFNIVISAAAAPLIAFGIAALKCPLTARDFVLVQIGYASIVGWLYLTTVSVWQQHLIPAYDASSALPSSHDPPEYRPREVKASRQEVIAKYGGAEHGFVLDNAAHAKVTSSSSRKIRFVVDVRTNSVLRIRQFYYHGWAAFVDGTRTTASPSDPEGLIQIGIPAGKHDVTLTLLPQRPERIGRIVSGLCLAASILLALFLRPKPTSDSTKDVELVPEKIPDEAEPSR